MFPSSLDGYNSKTNTLLEIKFPYVNEFNTTPPSWNGFFANKEVPKNYWAQVQCQLYCSQVKFAYFLIYFNDTNYHVVRIYQDNNFINKMIKDSKKYLELLHNTKKRIITNNLFKTINQTKSQIRPSN